MNSQSRATKRFSLWKESGRKVNITVKASRVQTALPIRLVCAPLITAISSFDFLEHFFYLSECQGILLFYCTFQTPGWQSIFQCWKVWGQWNRWNCTKAEWVWVLFQVRHSNNEAPTNISWEQRAWKGTFQWHSFYANACLPFLSSPAMVNSPVCSSSAVSLPAATFIWSTLHFGQFLKSPWPYLQREDSIWPLQEKTENRKGGFRVKYAARGIR